MEVTFINLDYSYLDITNIPKYYDINKYDYIIISYKYNLESEYQNSDNCENNILNISNLCCNQELMPKFIHKLDYKPCFICQIRKLICTNVIIIFSNSPGLFCYDIELFNIGNKSYNFKNNILYNELYISKNNLCIYNNKIDCFELLKKLKKYFYFDDTYSINIKTIILTYLINITDYK